MLNLPFLGFLVDGGIRTSREHIKLRRRSQRSIAVVPEQMRQIGFGFVPSSRTHVCNCEAKPKAKLELPPEVDAGNPSLSREHNQQRPPCDWANTVSPLVKATLPGRDASSEYRQSLPTK